MRQYTGTAKLTYDGTTRDVLLSLDLNEYCLVVKYPQEKDVFEYLTDSSPHKSHDVYLTEVNIPTVNGTLAASTIDELFIKQYPSGGMSIHDSILNRSLQLSDPSCGIVTIKLMRKVSVIEFDYVPRSLNASELFYFGEFSGNQYFTAKIGTMNCSVNQGDRQLSIQSSDSLWENERRIRLAFSLLHGAPLSFFASYEANKVRISLSPPRLFQSSHRFYKDHKDVPDLFEYLFRFAMKLTPQEFLHWIKATAFLLEGKASRAELDICITNLFVFIEMFDESRTMSGNSLQKMLSIPLSDAKFLCGIRNRLVHQHFCLSEAICDADAELTRESQKYRLEQFDISGRQHPATTTVVFRLYERLNYYLAQQIGWGGEWNAYSSIFAND